MYMPALRERGEHVSVATVQLFFSADARAAAFDLTGHLGAVLGSDAQISVATEDVDVVRAEVVVKRAPVVARRG